MRNPQKLVSAKSYPLSAGSNHLIKHMEGGKLTRAQAMKAKCTECMGGFVDGRYDCHIDDCPLYPWMPYKGKEPT
jgi:hypothetical protein